MSNPNTPFGFVYMGEGRGGGAPGTGGHVERKIAAAYNTAICTGDAVQSLGTGYVSLSTTSVYGSNTCGIFAGCRYLSTSQGRVVYSNYWPTGDHAYDGVAFIIPTAGYPSKLFRVQTYSTYLTFADIGQNIDINVGTSSITGGWGTSGMTVAQSTLATTATLPWRVVDLYSTYAPPGTAGTDDTSNYNIVIVQSNPDYETGI